jgi:tetratricopeptide (TPR) repeat protein
MAAILRDRYDVHAKRETPGGDIIGTAANMISTVFCPGDLVFWVANGRAPAAYHGFIGFSLKDELNGSQAQSAVASVPADSIVGSPAWAEVEAFQAGYLAYLQGDDSTAVKRLTKAISLNPRSAGYGYYLGTALVNLDQQEKAIAAFKAALAGDSSSSFCAPIYYRLGLIHEAIGAKEEMRAAFEQVLVLDTGDEHIEDYARRALKR